MADKKKTTSLNVPKVERGVKKALTPGNEPEKQQTPIEQVISRELTEIIKEINFDAKFESIKTAIESKQSESLLPVLEKINNKLNPILGALYGISNINESTNMDTLLSKLGNLDPKLTMFSPINSVLESIYDILTTQVKDGSSNKSEDSVTAMSAELAKVLNYDSVIESINDNTNSIIDIISEKINDVISVINKTVNTNDFNLRTAQIIDAINTFSGENVSSAKKEQSSKVLQYDVNINASGLDPKTVESLIDLSKINVDSNEYLKNLDKIVSGLSAFEALNKIKLDSKNAENIVKVLKSFSELKFEDFSKNAKNLEDFDKTIQSLLVSVTSLQQLASIKTKSIDISKNIKVLNDIASNINDIDKVDKNKSVENSESIKDCVKHFLGININLILVAASFPLAYFGALAMEKEISILAKITGKLNEEIAPIDKNAEKNLKALGLVIMAASGLLLIGALIGGYILAHLVEVLAFTSTLSMFILSTIGAFNLATKGMKEAEINANDFTKLVLVSGGLMLLGAFIGGFILNNLESILGFTVALSAFILLTIGTFNLATIGMKEATSNANDFTKLLLVSGGLMLLGAFIGGFILNNLESILGFTVTLSAFILLTIGALNLATIGMKEAEINADKFAKLLIISGTIMLLGGTIMLLYTPLILGAFVFSISLALFISLTVNAFNLVSKDIDLANSSANQFVVLVGVAALSLMIGGFLFAQYPWMMLSTLAFGLYLTIFVSSIVYLFNKFNEDITSANSSANQFVVLVGIAALSLMIGGFLFHQYPWMMLSTFIFVLCLTTFIGGILLAYNLASKHIKRAKIDALNFAEIVGISASLMLIGGGIFLAFPGLDIACLKFVGVFSLFIGAILLAYSFASKYIKNIKNVAISFGEIILITAGAMLIGGGIFLAFPGLDIACIAFAGLSVLFITLFGVAIKLLGKIKEKELTQGELAMFAISGLIASLGVAFIVLGTAMQALSKIENPLLQLGIITGVLTLMAGIVIGIGFLLHIPVLQEVLIAGMLAIAGIELLIAGLGLAMSCIAKSMEDLQKVKGFKASEIIGAITQYLSIVPTILTLANPFIVIGMLAATTSIVAMSTAIKHIATAVKSACDLKTLDGRTLTTEDFALAASNIKTVVTVLGNALIEVYESNKEMFSAGTFGDLIGMDTPFSRVSKSCSTLGKLITKIAEGVKDFADLKMPIYDKGGNVSGYRSMTTQDFENAANSVKAVVTCLGGALIDIYNEEPEMFNWQLIGDNPFNSVLKSCSRLGKLISNISAGVKDFADLRMPIYNEKGQKIGERTMGQADFENASNSVKAVITCLGGALIDIYNENPEMFEWQFIGDNPFNSVLKSCSRLGKLISNISAGVKDFADLRMPIYNEKGQKIGERTMGQADFENAANSVKAVITCLGGALIETYNENPEMFDGGFLKDAPFTKVTKSCSKLGTLITNISAGVKDFADLRMPIYDEKGQKIGERTMTAGDFTNAAAAVNSVIMCLGKSLITTYNDNKEMFDGGWFSDGPFKKVIKSCSTLGTLITDISVGVKDFADLRMPIYDENGQKIGERTMTVEDFKNASEAVNSVITCLGASMITTYNDNQEMFDGGWFSDGPFNKVTKSCSTLGTLITDISNGVKSFADLRMPIYDENGKIIGERPMGKEDFTNAAQSVEAVVTCLGDALIKTYDGNEDMFSAGTIGDLFGADTKFAKVAKGSSLLGDVISKISVGVKDFATTEIPIYGKNGEIVGHRHLDKNDFNNAAENVKKVVECLGNALGEMYDDHKDWFSAGTFGDLLGMETPFAKVAKGASLLGQIVTDISAGVKDFALLRMPIYKDGQIVDYREMKEQDFVNAGTNIGKVVTHLAAALTEVYYKNPWLFWAGSKDDDSTFGRVVKSFQGIGELLTGASDAIKDFANLQMPVYDENGQIIGNKPINETTFELAKTRVRDVLLCLAGAVHETWKNNETIFKDDGWFSNSVENTPAFFVVKSLEGVGKLVSDSAEAIKKVLDMKLDFTEILGSSGDGSDGKVANIVSALAKSVKKAYDENPEMYKDASWFSNDVKNSPFYFVSECIKNVVPVVTSAANGIKYVSELPFKSSDLSENGELYKKVVGIVSVLPKAVIGLTNDKNYGETLTDSDSIDDFGTVNQVFGKFKDIIKTAKDAYDVALSIDLKDYNLDTVNLHIGKMLMALTNTIVSENIRHKEVYQSGLGILSMFNTFKSYSELIKQVSTVYTESISSLSSIGVSGKDNSVISTITDNLNAMINKLASSIKINNAALDTNSVYAFKLNITAFSSSINELIDTYSTIPTDLSKCNEALKTLEELNSNIYKINSREAFTKEDTGLDKYIKTLNNLDLNKTKAFSDLLNAMNELANKLGSLDNFTSVLNEKISTTLSNLAQQIKASGDIINKADNLQKKRHEAITKSIKEINSIMDKKLIVEVNHKEIQDSREDMGTPQIAGGPTLDMFGGGQPQWGQSQNTFGGNNYSAQTGGNNYSSQIGGIDYERLKLTIQSAIIESTDIGKLFDKQQS